MTLNELKSHWAECNENKTLEVAKKISSFFKIKKDWDRGHSGSYQKALAKGWITECCEHMTVIFTHWTKEQCVSHASKYKTLKHWEIGHNASIQKARKEGWLNDCHLKKMILSDKPTLEELKNFWSWNMKNQTLELIKEISIFFKSISEWQKTHKASYYKAYRNNWINECTKHMDRYIFVKWTKEKCKSESLKYKTRTEWLMFSISSYQKAIKKGWFDECVKHMEWKGGTAKTKEECKYIALGYNGRKDWEIGNQASYQYAKKKGWYDECTEHMESALGGYDRKKAGVIYILEVVSKLNCKWYKIGISNYGTKKRFTLSEKEHYKVISEEFFNNGEIPAMIELTIKRKLKGKEIPKHIFPMLNGYSETFKTTKKEMISIYNNEKLKAKKTSVGSQLGIFT